MKKFTFRHPVNRDRRYQTTISPDVEMEEEDNISTAGFSRRNSLMKLPVKMSKRWWNCIEGIQIPKLKQPSEKEAHSVKFSDTNQSIPSPKNSIFQEGMLYR